MGRGGMKETLERGATLGTCCPLYEGGMYPTPGGAMWGISGVGKCDELVTVTRSILMRIPWGHHLEHHECFHYQTSFWIIKYLMEDFNH